MRRAWPVLLLALAGGPLPARTPATDAERPTLLRVLWRHAARGEADRARRVLEAIGRQPPSASLRLHSALARLALGARDASTGELSALALDEPFTKAGREAEVFVELIRERIRGPADWMGLAATVRARGALFAGDAGTALSLARQARAGPGGRAFADALTLVAARAHEDLGQASEALAEYQRLVLDHPQSPHYSTAQERVLALWKP